MAHYELSFRTNDDGTVTMESADSEGGGSCWNYLPEAPKDLLRTGRILQTSRGTKIQTGIVLAEDGTGRGVAWRITNVLTDEDMEAWRNGFPGQVNSVPALMPMSPKDRYTAVEEAKLRMSYHGWNFSGAVVQAVVDVEAGRTPCLDRWRESMAQHQG